MVNAITTLLASFIGAGAAIWIGYWSTKRILANQYRPVLWPTPISDRGEVIMLENIGNGPALGILLLTDTAHGSKVMGRKEQLPPPGPPVTSKHMIGVWFTNKEGIEFGVEFMDGNLRLPSGRIYRLLYQDIANTWHETQFTVHDRADFEVRFLGPIDALGLRTVPDIAKKMGLRTAR